MQARLNRAVFASALCFWDFAWVAVSRANYAFNPAYSLPSIDGLSFLAYFLLCFFLFLTTWLLLEFFSKLSLPTFWKVNSKFYLLLSFLVNLYLFFSLSDSYRYVSGGLSSSQVAMHYFSIFLTLASVLMIVLEERKSDMAHRICILLFIAGLVLRIDGLSTALTLFLAIGLIYKRKMGVLSSMVFICMAIALIWLGIASKFEQLPSYFSFNFMLGWAASRFAISGELALFYLYDQHYLSGFYDVLRMTGVALDNRLGFIFDANSSLDYVKSIGSANYFTLYGNADGGASPGYIGSIFLLGPLAPLSLVLILPFFSNILRRAESLGPVKVFALAIFMRPLYVNQPEIFVFFSSTTVVLTLSYFFITFAEIRR